MASSILDLAHHNISFETIPVSWLIAIAPRIWARRSYNTSTGKDLDNRHPRHFSQSVADDASLSAETRGRIIRAEAALNNSLDNVALFAAAIVAGNAARLSPKLLNGLSLTYLACRVVFNVVYIRNMPVLRTVAFFSGLGTCFTMFIAAGMKFRNGLV